MRDDRNRKIDFEPGKSAGMDEEEGPVLQRKQANVQRGSLLHRSSVRDSDDAAVELILRH
jgi:hypothetical protein